MNNISIDDGNNSHLKVLDTQKCNNHLKVFLKYNSLNVKKDNLEDISSNDSKLEAKFNLLDIPQKNRMSKSTLSKNLISKKIKKVTLDNPFISIVNIESYKDFNLKMTYNEYESISDINQTSRSCPCIKPICSIF